MPTRTDDRRVSPAIGDLGLSLAAEAARNLLALSGREDEAVAKTPERFAKAWAFLTAGDHQDPKEILTSALFEPPPGEAPDEMVIVRGAVFFSTCEHHLLPFFGEATIGYVPHNKIVGVSKLVRALTAVSRRLQVQERITQQLADAVQDALGARGVGVVLDGRHLCKMARGVEQHASRMVTSRMLGCLREPSARAEFLTLAASPLRTGV